jgi:hypothetical protein
MRQASDWLIRRSVRNAGAPEGGAEKRTLAIAGEAGGLDVILQVSLQMMVAGHAVFLALFVELDPQATMLPVNVRHGHVEGGPDAGEGESQKGDQRPVA